jgi:BON domain-containing protein
MADLTGGRPRDEQAAYVDESGVDTLGELTDTDVYEGELEAGVHDDLPTEAREQNIEGLSERELRAGETSNPDVAAEEGLTYVPPIDPPVVPSETSREGAEIAAGFGVSALDETYDEDHHSSILPGEDEMAARIREAVLADSTTTQYAEHLAIASRNGVVHVRGVVDDVDDTDNVIAVIERVDGVVEVVDELQVRVLG